MFSTIYYHPLDKCKQLKKLKLKLIRAESRAPPLWSGGQTASLAQVECSTQRWKPTRSIVFLSLFSSC